MIKLIGFDADDTLWRNEDIFERAHERFRALLDRYHPAAEVDRVLFATEMRNLPLYGYGVKGFTLSCLESAIALGFHALALNRSNAAIDEAEALILFALDACIAEDGGPRNRDAGTALVLVTHDPDLATRTQRTIRLRGGAVVEDTNREAVLA